MEPVNLLNQFEFLLPRVCTYVENHEQIILDQGVPLEPDHKIDAWEIGVSDIEKVRLMKVGSIPLPDDPLLKKAVKLTGLVSSHTAGITFRYGIYIRADRWNERRLVVHELTHTMQYERMGGIESFLREYLHECLTLGYPNGPLEKEAIEMEKKICNQK